MVSIVSQRYKTITSISKRIQFFLRLFNSDPLFFLVYMYRKIKQCNNRLWNLISTLFARSTLKLWCFQKYIGRFRENVIIRNFFIDINKWRSLMKMKTLIFHIGPIKRLLWKAKTLPPSSQSSFVPRRTSKKFNNIILFPLFVIYYHYLYSILNQKW